MFFFSVRFDVTFHFTATEHSTCSISDIRHSIIMLDMIRRFFKFLHWLYLQYLLNTALYMLEPWERILFSTLLVAILSTALYSALVFLPHHLRSMI